MKLHDLKPADGSRTPRTRVGRGIAAGKGKTAGRGTKGQKARAGGSIPPWFEGGQTPLHMRIPKLRGFKNRLKVEYEIVNVGRIGQLALLGAFEAGDVPASKKPAKAAPITVNQEILRAVGLVRTLDKPLKVLGQGDIEVALFVVADAFSKSAVAKIEAAGGSTQALEIPTRPLPALGLEAEHEGDTATAEVVAPDDEPVPAKPVPAKRAAEAGPIEGEGEGDGRRVRSRGGCRSRVRGSESAPEAPAIEAAADAAQATTNRSPRSRPRPTRRPGRRQPSPPSPPSPRSQPSPPGRPGSRRPRPMPPTPTNRPLRRLTRIPRSTKLRLAKTPRP